MPSVIEIYRRTLNKSTKSKDGDVLGLVRVLYPDVECNNKTVEILLNKNKKTKGKKKK